jgi:hypothetical protein
MIGRFRTVQLTCGTVVIELKPSADKRDRLPATLHSAALSHGSYSERAVTKGRQESDVGGQRDGFGAGMIRPTAGSVTAVPLRCPRFEKEHESLLSFWVMALHQRCVTIELSNNESKTGRSFENR